MSSKTPPAGGNPPVRRAPVQERSQETVQRIYDAASRLLARGLPMEELTTGQIATEAGVSVGALYRFFPDKQAIVDAVATKSIEQFQAELIGRFMLAPPTDGPALLGVAIDAFMAFLESHPDFRTIAYGGIHVSAGAREHQLGADAGIAVMVKQFLVGLGFPIAPDFDLRLRIVTEAGDRLIAYALAQADPDLRGQVVGEVKRLLGTYLFA
jgi:AcrR family transcriptional regulator